MRFDRDVIMLVMVGIVVWDILADMVCVLDELEMDIMLKIEIMLVIVFNSLKSGVIVMSVFMSLIF